MAMLDVPEDQVDNKIAMLDVPEDQADNKIAMLDVPEDQIDNKIAMLDFLSGLHQRAIPPSVSTENPLTQTTT